MGDEDLDMEDSEGEETDSEADESEMPQPNFSKKIRGYRLVVSRVLARWC